MIDPHILGLLGASMALGITDAGRAVVSARLYGTASAAFGAIGIGTGSTAFATSQTALVTGVKADSTADGGVHALASGSVTPSSVTTTITNDTAQFTGNISITGTIAIAECGLFNADTSGTMLARQTFTAVNVVSGDTFSPTWKIKNA